MNLEESKYTSRRLRSSYISTVVSISLILFTLGLLGMLILGGQKLRDYVKEHIQMAVYLNEPVSETEVSAMQDLLTKSRYVKSVRFVSKEEALDSLKTSLGENAVSMLESNPLPPSFDVYLKASYANPDSMKAIQTQLSQSPMVREVSYQENEVGLLNKNLKAVGIVIFLFSSILFLIAFALINNMVRLAIYSRRFLIKSMQLVGATRSFIRRPFIRKGFLNGLYGGMIACLMLAASLWFIQRKFGEMRMLQDFQTMGMLFCGILLAGLVISGISTFFAVRKYLRVSADELHL